MANYIAVPTKHVPDYLICHAVVPAGQTLHVGSVVALESIADARNYSVWTMTAPAANAKHVGIIVGAGIEELSDGRRPAGNVDWTTYTFKAGDVVTVVMLEKFMSFEISKDALGDNTNVAVGNFLVADGTYALATAAASAGNPATLKIVVNDTYFRNGGNAGGGFVPTLIVRVE